MAVQDTFDISWTGNIVNAKKLTVLSWKSSPYPIAVMPSEVFETLTGKTGISLGHGKKVFDIEVYATPAGQATGYMTIGEIRQYIFESADPTVNNYVIRDMEGNTYTVVCLNKSDANAIMPMGLVLFGNQSGYRVQLKFKEA